MLFFFSMFSLRVFFLRFFFFLQRFFFCKFFFAWYVFFYALFLWEESLFFFFQKKNWVFVSKGVNLIFVSGFFFSKSFSFFQWCPFFQIFSPGLGFLFENALVFLSQRFRFFKGVLLCSMCFGLFFQKIFSNRFFFLSKGFFQEGLFFFTRGFFRKIFFFEKKRCCLFFKGVVFANGFSFSKDLFWTLCFQSVFCSKFFF